MQTLRYVVLDVFTDRPLCGNPLAVFTDARSLDGRTMQALARELNLSETAFLLPAERGGQARVRIFTPYRELPFAGHPTLGAAFVLGGPLERGELALELEVGTVTVRLEREGPRVTFGWMTQPPARPYPFAAADAVLAALGVTETSLPVAALENGPEHVLVALPSASAVAAIEPDFGALARLTNGGVSVFHAEGLRCKARYFAPAAGVFEDPATGSAAGPLALHLHRHGRLALGEVLEIEQGAEIGRPSRLYARLSGAGAEPSIEVGGSAQVVARGQFTF